MRILMAKVRVPRAAQICVTSRCSQTQFLANCSRVAVSDLRSHFFLNQDVPPVHQAAIGHAVFRLQREETRRLRPNSLENFAAARKKEKDQAERFGASLTLRNSPLAMNQRRVPAVYLIQEICPFWRSWRVLESVSCVGSMRLRGSNPTLTLRPRSAARMAQARHELPFLRPRPQWSCARRQDTCGQRHRRPLASSR